MSTCSSSKTSKKGITLCASCNRCRSRKTKCDGKRPCGNCAARYLKKHRLTSIEGIDVSLFDCVYSPAKRRGPVPGKAGQTRKAEEMKSSFAGGSAKGNSNLMRMDMGMSNGFGNFNARPAGNMLLNQQQAQLAAMGLAAQGGGVDVNGNAMQGQDALTLQNNLLMQQQMAAMQGMGMNNQQGVMPDLSSTSSSFGNFNQQGLNGSFNVPQQNAMNQQQLNILALQQSQQQQQQQKDAFDMMQQMQANNANNAAVNASHDTSTIAPLAQRPKMEPATDDAATTNKSVAKHLDLLQKSSNEGNRHRSYFSLSIGGLFLLPPIPSDEEYCAKLNSAMSPNMLPRFDLAALRAARFAEIALGALVGNQVPLALELSNATVLCLKECVEEHIHPGCMFDVARAYFLHAVFRSYRGDMERYFKYRRVCLSKLTQMGPQAGNDALLAAISFHDAWAYILYNGDENAAPIDDSFPELTPDGSSQAFITAAEQKYQTSTSLATVAARKQHKNWIQGAPPVFINNEAPPLCRALDALACSMRSCCDQAINRFEDMDAALGGDDDQPSQRGEDLKTQKTLSLTSAAIMANKDELCARNMVLSAFTLLQQHESCANSGEKNQGYHLLISGMDAFLEDGDEDEGGGFTDSQVQSLLSVCNLVIERPTYLFQGGLTYHMVTNCAVLLAHLLNGLYAKREESPDHPRDMEEALFDEVLDTYISIRKVLSAHRRKLPPILRCHGLPRPKILGVVKKADTFTADTSSIIDLGETLMCTSRACQGFVLMGCSPCVAAERAREAKMNAEKMVGAEEVHLENGAESNERYHNLRSELDMGDDALLSILSRIIAS